MDLVMDLVLEYIYFFLCKGQVFFFLFYCKYEVPNWFGYGFYKIFCENFIFFEGGDVVTGESNYRCRSVTELIA
jgi:hypothetical protein